MERISEEQAITERIDAHNDSCSGLGDDASAMKKVQCVVLSSQGEVEGIGQRHKTISLIDKPRRDNVHPNLACLCVESHTITHWLCEGNQSTSYRGAVRCLVSRSKLLVNRWQLVSYTDEESSFQSSSAEKNSANPLSFRCYLTSDTASSCTVFDTNERNGRGCTRT